LIKITKFERPCVTHRSRRSEGGNKVFISRIVSSIWLLVLSVVLCRYATKHLYVYVYPDCRQFCQAEFSADLFRIDDNATSNVCIFWTD